jgi:hypothetical protein
LAAVFLDVEPDEAELDEAELDDADLDEAGASTAAEGEAPDLVLVPVAVAGAADPEAAGAELSDVASAVFAFLLFRDLFVVAVASASADLFALAADLCAAVADLSAAAFLSLAAVADFSAAAAFLSAAAAFLSAAAFSFLAFFFAFLVAAVSVVVSVEVDCVCASAGEMKNANVRESASIHRVSLFGK